ncbi:MAG TPA: hypothetical protein PK400_11055 [Phycisphaerales bacterium]|nr:hypothetical protein [Phycisphaerales bacterium]HRQ76456.1 hypothetical protein [Phycisphaerales bacterium]
MLIIIHGWSDTSNSFKRLGNLLKAEGIVSSVAHVRLGDYISLDDDVTFDDLSTALQAAWVKEKLPTSPRSCDVVIHSTGGLVIRHWLTTHHKPQTNPIHRLLMLAPANFGSHLAHKGRSFVGRVVKGFKSERRFHTGAKILDGLELASPFTWELAQQDRFGSETWYGSGAMLCTVLVGTAGYGGISAVANESGSDGTVRVSTANLDPLYVKLDFAKNPQEPTVQLKRPKGSTAFARLPGVNHTTITLNKTEKTNSMVLGFIKEALTVTDSSFDAHIARLHTHSEQARNAESGIRHTQAYQNTVVRLTDDAEAGVEDYFFELFAKRRNSDGSFGGVDNRITAIIQQEIFGKVHNFKADPSYRSMLFNINALRSRIISEGLPLFASITAMPDIRQTKTVGYSTVGYDDIGSIRLDTKRLNELFQPDRTVLIDIVIKREQTERVFQFKPLT